MLCHVFSKCRKSLSATAVAILIIVIADLSCSKTAPDADPPKTFELTLDTAPMGASVSVKWDGGALLYDYSGSLESDRVKLRVVPNAVAWSQFWKKMDDVEAWNWRPRYDSTIDDGLVWDVEITCGGKKISSRGHNAYPGDAGPQDIETVAPTKRFKAFQTAVEELLGRGLYQK